MGSMRRARRAGMCDIGPPYIQGLMRASSLDRADGGLNLPTIYQRPSGSLANQRFCDAEVHPRKVEGQNLYLNRAPVIARQSGRTKNLARFLIAVQ